MPNRVRERENLAVLRRPEQRPGLALEHFLESHPFNHRPRSVINPGKVMVGSGEAVKAACPGLRIHPSKAMAGLGEAALADYPPRAGESVIPRRRERRGQREHVPGRSLARLALAARS